MRGNSRCVLIPILGRLSGTLALEIRTIDFLFVGSSACHFGAGYFVQHWHIRVLYTEITVE